MLPPLIFFQNNPIKKTVARETNFLTTALLNLQKKHSQTVKGSTMFPEWWTIQDSNL